MDLIQIFLFSGSAISIVIVFALTILTGITMNQTYKYLHKKNPALFYKLFGSSIGEPLKQVGIALLIYHFHDMESEDEIIRNYKKKVKILVKIKFFLLLIFIISSITLATLN